MANDDFPRGLVPLNWPSVTGHYYRVTTGGGDLYLGMPVSLAASGFVGPVAVDSAGAVVSIGVLIGFAGTLKRGIATRNPYLKVADVTPPTPSSDTGDRYALVADDPNMEFFMQEDTGGTALTIADAGQGVSLLYRATSGDTTTGWTSLEVDRSQIVASNSGICQLLRLHDQPNTDGTENAAGNYGKWVVRLMHHQKRGGVSPLPV